MMSKGGYYVNNKTSGPYGETNLLTNEQMLGKWNDILINIKWSSKVGFFKIWVNNELAYDYKGLTKRGAGKVNFKFGIYRYSVFIEDHPTQIVYFDEVRIGKNKRKSCWKSSTTKMKKLLGILVLVLVLTLLRSRLFNVNTLN